MGCIQLASAAWHPWTYEAGGVRSIGGYAVAYDTSAVAASDASGFAFVTVRGGRHEVPETAPDRAYAMVETFLSGGAF